MKNEVEIKSVYMMSSEFGLRSGKSRLKILIARGLNKRGVGISSWNRELGVFNSFKWLAFAKFKLIGGVVVIVEGEIKM